MSEIRDWGAELRALRIRLNLKQDVIAHHLNVSQGYLSRIENGRAAPSPAMRAELESLLSNPRNRPLFDDWRNTVRFAETVSSLIRFEDGAIRAVEMSRGFRAFGGAFDDAYEGMPLNGTIGADADEQFERLIDRGLFDGDVAAAESVWSTDVGDVRFHLRSISVPVRDDWGVWHVHSNHRLIDEGAYRELKSSRRDTVLLPDGDEMRFPARDAAPDT